MKLTFIFTLLALTFCLSIVQSCGINAEKVVVSNTPEKCYCQEGYFGTQEDADKGECKPCPLHSMTRRYESIGGVEKCQFCDRGYYGKQRSNNFSECTLCPSNSLSFYDYNNGNIDGPENCKACNAGFYVKTQASAGNSAECVPCPDNTTSNFSVFSKGKAACSYCKKGYSMQVEGKKTELPKCVKCPKFTTTDGDITSVYDNQCRRCIPDYYEHNTKKIAGICTQCPKNSRTIESPNFYIASIDYCTCDDPNARLPKALDSVCHCGDGFTGGASKENPCKKIELSLRSLGNLLMISFSLILFVLSF